MTIKKNQNRKGLAVHTVKSLATALALSTVLVGCAKDLPEKESDVFSYDDSSSTSEIALAVTDASKAEVIVKTVKQNTEYLSSASTVSGVSALGSSKFYDTKVVSSSHGVFEKLVKDLKLNAEAEDTEFRITFDVTETALVAYVEKISGGISTQGLNTSFLPNFAQKQEKFPLFQYSIRDFGVKKRRLNDRGEETRYIQFKSADWTSASHFLVTPLPQNRKMSGLQGLSLEDAQEIYNKERLEREIWSGARAKNLFAMSESPTELIKNNDKLRLKVYESELYIYKAINKDSLTKEEKELIANNYEIREIADCDGDIANAVAMELQSCLLKAVYYTDIDHVRLKYSRDENNELLASTSIASEDTKVSRLIKISKDSKIDKAFIDNKDNTVFKKDELNGTIVIKTGSKAELENFVNEDLSELTSSKLTASQNVNFYEVVTTQRSKLNRFVKDLKLPATKSGAEFKISFKVEKSKLVAYISEQPGSEGTLVRDFYGSEYKSTKEVPAFDFDIKHGFYLQTGDEQGAGSSNFKFIANKNVDKATHINVSNILDRNEGGLEGLGASSGQDIYSLAALEDKVWNRNEIRVLFKDATLLEKSKYDNYQFKADEPLLIHRSAGKLIVGRVVSESDLTQSEKRLLSLNEGNGHIYKCNAETAKKVGREGQSCFVRRALEQSVSYVDFRSTKDSDGFTTASVETYPTQYASRTKFVKLTGSSASETDVADIRTNNNVELKLTKFKGKEFSFRRVLEDAPNVFNYAVAGRGASKWFNVEIVKFEFKEKEVHVVKSKPNLSKRGTTEADYETLMIYPVRYKRYERFTEDGKELKVPLSYVTDHNDPNAVAVVDLSRNQALKAYSPLDLFNAGMCFAGESTKDIVDVKQVVDGKDDYLNFTISSTFNSNPSYDCAGVRDWSNTTSMRTLKIKERVSFKRYTTKDTKPMIDIPYELQKKFNYGLFTGEKTVPQGYSDDTYAVGSTQHLPMIFDIRNGKQIEYVLAGIPSDKYDANGKLVSKMSAVDKDLREKLIKSTKKVIEDMNEGFKRAFKGTPLEGRSDVIVLKIENDGSISDDAKEYMGLEVKEKGHIGDLSRNYIYWIAKGTQSGLLGVGGPHHDPRNGFVEGASVYLYGGNMKMSLDWMVDAAKAEKKWIKDMKVPKNWKVHATEQAQTADAGADSQDAQTGQAANAEGSAEAQAEAKANAALFAPGIAELTDSVQSLSSAIARKAPTKNFVLDRNVLEDNRFMDQLEDIQSGLQNETQDDYVTLKNIAKSKIQKDIENTYAVYKALHDKKMANREAIMAAAEFGEGSPEHKQALIESRLNSTYARTEDGQARPICLHMESDVVMSKLTEKYDIVEKTKTDFGKNDVLVDTWASTLAHEIGHNIGLRHNFVGTFDKRNWKFADEGETTRTSSSVMDYSIEDHATQDGLGPYDVYAIRAAYTGFVELEGVTAQPKESVIAPNGNKVPVTSFVAMDVKGKTAKQIVADKKAEINLILADIKEAETMIAQGRSPEYFGKQIVHYTNAVNELQAQLAPLESQLNASGRIKMYGNLVHVNDVIKALDKENRNTISKKEIEAIGVREIQFCSDEEAGDSPQCQRHDWGTTFNEIVDHEIRQYKKLYNYIYFPGNSKRWGSSRSIRSNMRRFSKLRMLNEEVLYQLIYNRLEDDVTGVKYWRNEQKVNDLLSAVFKAKDFFMSVVGTPEAPAYADPAKNPSDRFIPAVAKVEVDQRDENGKVVTDEFGKTVKVEKDVVFKVDTKWSGSISIDADSSRVKVKGTEYDKAAAMFALTMDRSYSWRYLRHSLRASYVDYFSMLYGLDRSQSDVLALIEDVLRDNVSPMVYRFNKLIRLDNPVFETRMSDIVKTYASYGALLFLDAPTADPVGSPSRSFLLEKVVDADDLEVTVQEDEQGNKTEIVEPFIQYTGGDYFIRANADDSHNSAKLITMHSVLENANNPEYNGLLDAWNQMTAQVATIVDGAEAKLLSEEELQTVLAKIQELAEAGNFGQEYLVNNQSLAGHLQALKANAASDAEKVAYQSQLRSLKQNLPLELLTAQSVPVFAKLGYQNVSLGALVNYIRSNYGPKITGTVVCSMVSKMTRGQAVPQFGCSDAQKNLIQGVKNELEQTTVYTPNGMVREIKSRREDMLNNMLVAELNALADVQLTQNGVSDLNALISLAMEKMPMDVLFPRAISQGEKLEDIAANDAEYARSVNKLKPTKTVSRTLKDYKQGVYELQRTYESINGKL